MSIPLVKEGVEFQTAFGEVEFCYFGCGRRTRYWHWRTNQPICQDCAKAHKVAEVQPCSPAWKATTKAKYCKPTNQ